MSRKMSGKQNFLGSFFSTTQTSKTHHSLDIKDIPKICFAGDREGNLALFL